MARRKSKFLYNTPFNLLHYYYIYFALSRNPSCRILITTGEGKFYSNGLDLGWLSVNKDKFDDVAKALMDTVWRLIHFPIPTVAAINGKFEVELATWPKL